MIRGCFIMLLFVAKVDAQSFYFGADLSYVNEMEDCGASFNINGIAADPYQIFKDNGANTIRLRLWHTPSWYDILNDGQRYCDFEDVKRSIMRAKAEGMQVLLDFHLSDNWADPSKQVAPTAWTSVLDDLPVLQDSLYNYIYTTLDELASENLLPELVQIGNETNKGILLSQEDNDNGWMLDWARNSALFNTAISAIRDIEALHEVEIRAAIHIADPSSVSWYIGQFIGHGVVDFDIIGMSYYWQWHDDTFEEVGGVIASLKDMYPEKEIMIFETAYPWTTSNADGANNLLAETYPGYTPFNPANQRAWLVDLAQKAIDHGVTGMFYWEPAWVSTDCRTQWAKGSSWDNATFFDHQYELMTDGGVAWMTHAYDFPTSTDDLNTFNKGIDIFQTGNELWIRRNEKSLFDSELNIHLYTMEGRLIYHQRHHPVWEDNQYHFAIPEFLPGCYLITISGNKDFAAAKVMIL
jgi:arabinogalactan endo-1,4-beta-galactosidase